jgi:hypothetical protein
MRDKLLQTIRISIIADRIENKPTNHKITMSGLSLDEAVDILRGALKKLELDEAVDILRGALKKLEEELEIQREKLCVIGEQP